MPTPCKNPVLRLLRGSGLVVDTNQVVVNNSVSKKVVGKGGYRARTIWRQGLDSKAYRANATKLSDKPLLICCKYTHPRIPSTPSNPVAYWSQNPLSLLSTISSLTEDATPMDC